MIKDKLKEALLKVWVNTALNKKKTKSLENSELLLF